MSYFRPGSLVKIRNEHGCVRASLKYPFDHAGIFMIHPDMVGMYLRCEKHATNWNGKDQRFDVVLFEDKTVYLLHGSLILEKAHR